VDKSVPSARQTSSFASLSGGDDAIMAGLTTTILCLDCKELMDVTRGRFKNRLSAVSIQRPVWFTLLGVPRAEPALSLPKGRGACRESLFCQAEFFASGLTKALIASPIPSFRPCWSRAGFALGLLESEWSTS
jgi:hypothetical protein